MLKQYTIKLIQYVKYLNENRSNILNTGEENSRVILRGVACSLFTLKTDRLHGKHYKNASDLACPGIYIVNRLQRLVRVRSRVNQQDSKTHYRTNDNTEKY